MASHPATQVSKSDVVLYRKFTALWAKEKWADALDLKLTERSAGGKAMGGIWQKLRGDRGCKLSGGWYPKARISLGVSIRRVKWGWGCSYKLRGLRECEWQTNLHPLPNASGDPGVHMCSFSQYPAIGQWISESLRFAPVCQRTDWYWVLRARIGVTCG